MQQISPAHVLVVEHEDGTGPGLFGERLTAAGLRVDLRRPWAGDPLPSELDGHDGLLVLGGSMGPSEDARAGWLPQVRALLREAVAADVPTFAICLGMELLTVACGGEVRRAEHPEVGLHPLRALPAAAADPLFAELTGPDAPPLGAVQWHWEETGVLPAGAVPLLTGDRCEHQAYRLGGAVWGVQFHPEVLAEHIRSWGTTDLAPLHALGLEPATVVAEVAGDEARLLTLWAALADRWATLVSARPAR